jgi:hypothetical protein
MKYRFKGKILTLVCMVNAVQHGGEYTMCGYAIPDTTLEDNVCKHVGDAYMGKLKDVTCPNCLDFIKYIQRLK